MSTIQRVGAETDAFCTKCELLLAHTILAMIGPKIARVRCETCKAEHAYRGVVVPAGAAKPKKPRKAKAPEKVIIGFEERLKAVDLAKARTYSPKESFVAEEVMQHPTFGYGIVTTVRGDKIDVAFKTFEKVLLHKRHDGQAARPTFGARVTTVAAPSAASEPEANLPATADGGSAPT